MKKIIFLTFCIAAVLGVCFADGYIRRGRALPAASAGAEGADADGAYVASADGADGTSAGGADGVNGRNGANTGNAAGTNPNDVGSADGANTGDAAGINPNDTNTDGMAGAQDAAGHEEDETIRVLIKTAGFASSCHEQVVLDTALGFTAQSGEHVQKYPAGQIVFTGTTEEFADGKALRLTSADGRFDIRELNRDRADETYEGVLELRRAEEGILLINELPLEEYLKGVVSSEMPSSYPEEALKAQAVCARTYARRRMQEQSLGNLFADVDDSVSFQVYNNQDRSAAVDEAVEQTAQVVMTDEKGNLIDALYYSTSCGLDVHADLSGEAVFAAFLSEGSLKAYEAEEPWFRWQTDLNAKQLGDICDLAVQERLPSGAADRMLARRTDGSEQVIQGEYDIRAFLGALHPVVTLQDGEEISDMALLPSAFFSLQPVFQGDVLQSYHILGGGYGHGQGMSQNGAKRMAQEGMDFQEILKTYYGEVQIGPQAAETDGQ